MFHGVIYKYGVWGGTYGLIDFRVSLNTPRLPERKQELYRIKQIRG